MHRCRGSPKVTVKILIYMIHIFIFKDVANNNLYLLEVELELILWICGGAIIFGLGIWLVASLISRSGTNCSLEFCITCFSNGNFCLTFGFTMSVSLVSSGNGNVVSSCRILLEGVHCKLLDEAGDG